MEKLRGALEHAGIATQVDCPLSRHSTFRIGGCARLAVFPKTPEDFMTALRLCYGAGARTAVIGNGSNVLFDDAGYSGVIVFTKWMRQMRNEADGFYAQAGASLAGLAAAACERSLAGAAFAGGIPGTVGGAVFMNAGAHGGEMAQIVTCADCYDSAADCRVTLKPEMLDFAYRMSILQKRPELILLGVGIRLRAGDSTQIAAEMREYRTRRKATQPLDLPSAGSAFRRPAVGYAAELIDRCGLKGARVGGAQVSTCHAGFVVNVGSATSRDVLTLMEQVRGVVLRQTGVVLEPEIRYLAP